MPARCSVHHRHEHLRTGCRGSRRLMPRRLPNTLQPPRPPPTTGVTGAPKRRDMASDVSLRGGPRSPSRLGDLTLECIGHRQLRPPKALKPPSLQAS